MSTESSARFHHGISIKESVVLTWLFAHSQWTWLHRSVLFVIIARNIANVDEVAGGDVIKAKLLRKPQLWVKSQPFS